MRSLRKVLLFLLILLLGQKATAQNFITQWNLATSGSGATQLTFGTATSGLVNYTWQEISPGSATGSGSWSGSTLLITGLPTGATIRLQIAPTNFQRIIMSVTSDRPRLTQVEQWGSTAWSSMQDAFFACTNLQVTATDVPNLTGVTNMSQMFRQCANLNSPSNINSWNTAAVTNMSLMFFGASAFNQNIGSWNTSSVTNMQGMFRDARDFNQNIGLWNVAAVATMAEMFENADAFNNGGSNSLNNWNTGAVTDMSQMFLNANSFNQEIGGWNTALVTRMDDMFQATPFNNGGSSSINNWNTGAVTTMEGMFWSASAFNQNIGSWNTGAVTDMSGMFLNASSFNNGGSNSINNWNTGAVTNMREMFRGSSAFNQNIGSWNTSAVTTMQGMFFQAGAFNQNIGSWNTVSVTNMSQMFASATAFNNGGSNSINNWNTGAVTNMIGMFNNATVFNQNIGAWNTAAVTNMSQMFFDASAFNQNIGLWNTAAVTNMAQMFLSATSFNQNIGSWNTGSVTSMASMFLSATSFNQNIGLWNTTSVTTMVLMFNNATAFNQNLGAWTLNAGVGLGNMFLNSGLDCNNYSATLIGWNANPLTPNGRTLGTTGRQYGTNAVAARTNLITTKGWTITGDTPSGTVCSIVPTISNFIPTNGPIGTTVTITGTNFSSTPANNIVYFGAVRANVTAATATQLTVTVPTGATYQPITVQVAGLTAYSSKPFVVTFAGGGSIDACSFAPPIAIRPNPVVGPINATLVDLDGDGKAEIVNCDEGNDRISIIRNISTPGSLTAGSFASEVTLSAGDRPVSVAYGDLDGDGKPDLAVTNNNNSFLSIFKNISTVGTLVFASRVDITVPTFSAHVAISDIDLDGKLDLTISSQTTDQLIVMRNIGSPGVINAGSFATGIGFSTGDNPFRFTLGDLDRDGKMDAIVPNSNTYSVSILRNTSTPGSVSFASQIVIPTAVGSPGFPAACFATIGDIDGDEVADLAVNNLTVNTISLFRNTSSVGTISFDPKFDLSAPINGIASLADFDGDSKADLMMENNYSSVSIYKNVASSGIINAATFAAPVTFITSPGGLVSAGDLDGDGKSDIITNVGSVSVLRNLIGEISPPTVTSFAPLFGAVGSSVTITGTNFSTPFSNTVKINGITAPITGSTATSLTVTIPAGATTGPLEVTIGCNTVTSGTSFIVPLPPTITNFSPASGPIGTTVNITGTNFSTTPANNIVYFGATRAAVTAATTNQLTVTVPTGATYQPITVQVAGLTAYSSKPFVVTFVNSVPLNACAFAPRVDLAPPVAVGSEAKGTLGDVDGDGKTDLIVPDRANNLISIYRNIATAGSLSAGSFAPKIDFSTGTGGGSIGPIAIAFGDLDSDGKPDLAVTNYNLATISVFKNLSTAGSITLQARVDFPIGAFAGDGEIRDLDGDGKPELIVSSLSEISVLRNISTPGIINASSFAARVNTTVATPFPFSIDDFDGDGKPDIAVPNNLSNTLSLLRNVSSIGTISFASQITFPTGVQPQEAASADIDGDGKPDLIVPSTTKITFFRNTSTPGAFSFVPNDHAVLGPYTDVGDLDGDGKIDVAIANDGSNNISVLKNNNFPGAISFGANVDFSSSIRPYHLRVGDIDGDGKNDLINFSAGLSVFRSVLGEITPPTITSFAPLFGPVGSSVTINGTNFGTPFTNSVRINGITAFITGSTATSLTVTIPAGATTGPLEVTIGCSTVTSGTSFIVPLPPTITNFSPASGPIGTTVNITGTNFSTTPANNIVYFGAVRANVTAATPTQLTVTVPTGATYQPITVQVAGLTGFSSKPFVVTFAGGGSVNPCSFAPPVNYGSVTQGFTRGALGDLDGDGKTDVFVPDRDGNVLSIYRNTSTPGIINSGSFAPKIDLVVPNTPSSVAFGDLDGDGKPDLAVLNNNTFPFKISVFRNLSSPGTILMSSRVEFDAPTFAADIATADIDGDGKSDLLITSFSSGLTVLRNTSTVGTIDATSFAAGISFSTGPDPNRLSVADLDGDNKPDAIVPNRGQYSVSILRNTSTLGSISFAPQLVLPTGTGTPPAGLGTGATVVGDYDGDGKLEIMASNYSLNTIAIFRNTSSVGSVSFAPRYDLNSTVFAYTPGLSDLDGDGKIDLAFVGAGGNLSIFMFRNTSTPGVIDASSFSPISEFILGVPASVSIGDIDGDGKSDFVTETLNASVLRNVIGEISPPTVTSFAPLFGAVGSSVTITGTNFSTPFSNTVKINGITATITASTATTLTVTIPAGATTGLFDVTVGCNTVTSTSNFVVTVPPTIVDFNPKTGPSGTIISITGTNFAGATAVTFGGVAATSFTVVSPTSITAVVGSGASGNVSVTTPAGTATLAGFTFVPTATITISPQPTSISVCEGVSAAFTVSASGTTNILYQWQKFNGSVFTDLTNGGGYSGVTSTSLNVNTVGNFGAGDYRCKVSGDFATDVFSNTVTLTINTLPATPGVISGTTTICSGTSNTYSIAAVSGATSYTWTLPSGWTGTSVSNSISATSSTTSGNITVTANNACGTSAASTQAIVVNTAPATPGAITGSTTVCSGSTNNTYNIAAVSGATSYTWTLPSGWTGTSVTNLISTTASSTSGNITVTATNACGTSAASTQAIVVNTIPATPVTISGTTTLCAGSTNNTFSVAAVSGATSYTWLLPSGWTGTSTTNAINATASASGGNITVAASNACGTSAAQTLLITVNPLPAAPTIVSSKAPVSGKVVLCTENNETTTLSTSPTSFLSYNWSVGGSAPSITVGQSASVTVRGTDANGCQSLASNALVIDKTSCKPSIASATLSTTAGSVATQPLAALVTVAAALDINSLKVTKQPASGAVATISSGGVLSVNYAGISFVGSETITIEACDINGICSQQDLTIEVAGDVIVFNAISPNGDNKNEFVRMQYIESIPDTKSNKVMVFNRWGDLVFEINDYDNADRVFRGLDNNGDKLAVGTYYYRIDFTSGRSSKTGFISLRK